MSETKGTKRKSSLQTPNPKSSEIKSEPNDEIQNISTPKDNVKPKHVSVPNESSSSKAETSWNESAGNLNVNREPSDTFTSYMKNAILEEVLNAKKAALLQSPSVIKILRDEQIINRWKPSSEVWPYAYGNDILGLMSAFGGFFTTHFLRKELKIRPYARMTCYVPAVGLPAVGCYIFQSYVITSDILSKNGCPLCITTKSCLAQAIFGVVFPVTLSSVACFNVADRLLTYPIPPILKAPKEIFQLFQRLVQKRTRAFSIICAINIIAASFITHQKQNVLVNLDLVPRKKDS